MPNTVSTIVALVLGAATAPATMLSWANQRCAGEGISSCPGALDIFTGTPGTFLAGAVAQVSGDFPPFKVWSAGTIASAVFHQPNGELGYYYQIVMNDDAPFGFGNLDLYFPHNLATFHMNVGVRTDAIGTFGSVTFMPSAREPSKIRIGWLGPWASLGFDFRSAIVQPGEASATLVAFTSTTYPLVCELSHNYDSCRSNSSFDAIVPGYDYIWRPTSGSIVLPAEIPEPGTLSFSGFGLLVLTGIGFVSRFRSAHS